MSEEQIWEVHIGKGTNAYKDKIVFVGKNARSRAYFYYDGINVHSGGKKRLLCNGKVIRRTITTRY